MFSERQRDGVERDPEHYFKRYNAKVPEKGGARKGYGPHAGGTLTAATCAADLKALRMRWQDMTNQHLERAGVDVRSHAERKTGLEPEAKQLPSQWRGAGRGNVIEFRAARVEQRKAVGLLREEIPNISAEIINIEDARTLRDQAKAMAADGVAAIAAEQERQPEQVREAEAAKSRLDGLSNQGRSAKPKGYDGPGFG